MVKRAKLTGFSGIKFEIKEVFGQGDKLTKYWVFSGKHTGDFFGIAPTGKSVTLQGQRSSVWKTDLLWKSRIFLTT
ncbi:ester cyclase [Spirosoma validum]|uniref:Ester cyclase n=1 Tax=Spirosoma validum TaxID=2771355 RepID=A0A927GH18_9BACT|nr:ester cyclase [Spirosoma validum]